ncbi:DUF4178 domain-containing protein [Hymenobacter sp. CRA2]|uniref:DUF4178 domain-containing protein n=1 Tax=Hymenobacter sp. CRA2 TaxID=1955620 RepID=UPI00098F2C8B|nr:DUF4178 domain-containing protein [Hymenobacter sp. CRA2]OON66485.1 hypothetical protein B0919_21890 [Hymenobacter sp. CRA2]
MSETATLPTANSAELECPQCQHRITYYDVENSTHYACPQCHSYFEYEDPKPPRLLGKFQAGPEFQPQLIPLGATGLMPDGQTYRVVGYSARAEAASRAYHWGEYVLFCPPATYAQLAVYDFHWSFIRPTKQLYKVQFPTSRSAYVAVGDQDYRIYNKYSPVVWYAVGEFDYDIREDEKLEVTEHIDPPYMLVEEKAKGDAHASWYLAEYMTRKQVATAFNLPAGTLPPPNGTGAIEPAPGEDTWQPLLYISFGLALVAIVLQILLSSVYSPNTLLQYNFATEQNLAAKDVLGQSQVLVTPSFTVNGPTALYFDMHVGLDNQWLELPVSMVNEQTGQGYEFTKTFEYYHGYEGGESWSEGSMNADATLAQVPAGRYHLNLYPQSENTTSLSGQLSVTEHPVLQSNLLLLIALLLVFPVLQFIRRGYHESSRWTNSDYGPQENDNE